jgi:para-nitrobenzyl esterase
MRSRWGAVLAVTLGLVAAACSTAVGTPSPPTVSPGHYEVGADPLVIRTADGPVQGAQVGSVRRFLGVPYAAPPVGDLRWLPPQPPAAWTAPLDATRPGSECPQIVPIINQISGNEDCLYLNVFTPSPAPTRALPVMVWIHGGGFTVGSGMDDDPTRFVAAHHVVVVSMNYRLGPLGFLALPDLAQSDPRHSTGNLGLEDQQAALRWVRANAAAFGGDAGNVTIFGESAGGVSVCAQLLSPGSAGLFEKAITESGPCTLGAVALPAAEQQGAEFVAKLGCSGASPLACIQSKPVDEVLDAMPPDPTFLFGRGANWDPVADGVVLPSDPIRAFDAGDFHRVPMIVGANRDEGRLFTGLAYNAMGHPLPASQWAGAVDHYFGPRVGPLVRAEYPLSRYPDPGAAFGQAIGDAILACPAVNSATVASRFVPVYEYEYDHTPNPFVLPMPGIDLGAFHSAELPYVFGGPVSSSGPIVFSPAEQKLSDTVSGAWARFAATGSPDGAGLDWPQLSGASGRYLSLDTPVALHSSMKAATCGFWQRAHWSLGGS